MIDRLKESFNEVLLCIKFQKEQEMQSRLKCLI